ncbi:pentatricopeptide repeat-containing protein At2g22410, mitochondrial-like [Mercurialis annua]|uniref:pentatricopeptide repeat-containing protein At2g22410, mitochondrial-like n=1 Tax=Mercurialis annua TaxID=3986 RepID=UPI00215F0F17|nr:pentatricopeptide repeat-containing protein At2g22410, mitochondrial-like [Mercurialis annua]
MKAILRQCATGKPKQIIKNVKSIKEEHGQLIRMYLHRNPFKMSSIIKSYALSSSHLHQAYLAFTQIQQPTLLIFNYLIRGSSLSDNPYEAILMYTHLMYNSRGLLGDNLTFIFLFRACSRVHNLLLAQVFHLQVLKLGFGSYLYVANSLITMYASFRELECAHKVFDEIPDRDLVSWNSLICGYSWCNKFKEVLGLFHSMQEADVIPDSVTMVKLVLACNFLGDDAIVDSVVKYMEENHVHIDTYLGNTLIDMYGGRGLVDLAQTVFDGMQEKNIVSWNAMITGYAKAGNLVAANKLFNDMPSKNVISWTSMISGYVQANRCSDAVKLFQEMMDANVRPDEVTIATVLSACSRLGSLDFGQAVHEYICRHGVKADVYVGNTLIYMYCKCGAVDKALEVFHEMKMKDGVSWTSVILGLAVNGFVDNSIELFSLMLKNGVQPTHGSFLGVLLACTHAGLVNQGLEYFENMEKVYGVKPEMKHYGCVVDLLSRSGNLDKAYKFIKEMPVAPDVVVWRILLSACKLHGNLVLAEIATNKLLKLDPSNSGNYVLLSNTYAGSDRWNEASKMRELMVEGDVSKPSGWSSIEINGPTTNKSQCPFQ